MSAYRVLGIDSSGRQVRLSPEAADSWRVVCDVLGFTPVITQGGHLTNAAAASATTHAGDAIDLRTWNLTTRQREATIRVLRAHGWAAWFRDWSDPHIHAAPGRWAHPSPSALRQWDACKRGRDGLAGNGPDPHTYPLASKPPEDDMTPQQEKQLAQAARDAAEAAKDAKAARSLAQMAVRRGRANTTVMQRIAKQLNVKLDDLADMLEDLAAAEDAEGK